MVALSGSAVIDGGAALAAREGLHAVGMRSVARDLRVTPMSLYRHVGDAHSLRASVVDRLLESVPDVPAEGEWDERCRSWARASRDVLGHVPGLAHHVLLEWVHLPAVLAALEGLVATLESGGPPGCDSVAGANAILLNVLMRAQAEEAVRNHGIQRDLSTLRRHRNQLPRLWVHREEYRRARLDEHFEFGLDALLSGLSSARRMT